MVSFPNADAHPGGQRPVIEVERSGSGLDVEWIVAVDDFRLLVSYLGIPNSNPLVVEQEQAYRDYVTSKLTIETGSRRCSATMTGIKEVATGHSTGISMECAGDVASMTMHSDLLLDLNPSYIHRYRVQTAEGLVRGSLTGEESSVSIDFEDASSSDDGSGEDAQSRLEALVSGEGDLPLLFALGIAIALGMVHGLTPGHGKTLTVAYLAGSRGTLRQAGLLALVVALAHGVSTFALAMIASGLDLAAPQKLTPWLTGAMAVLTAAVGIGLLRGAILHGHSHGQDAHGHGKTHRHSKEHRHQQKTQTGIGGLVAIGLIGGIIPGPEAFAVGFLAVALGNLGLGLILVLAFSVGLALVVFAFASIAVVAGHRLPGGHRAEAIARRVGGLVFLVVAAILAYQVLPV